MGISTQKQFFRNARLTVGLILLVLLASLFFGSQTASAAPAPNNATPVAEAQSVTTAEDNAIAITLTGSDAENALLAFSLITNPAHGTLSGELPNLSYAPAANYFGADSFTFKVNDGNADSAPATISIDVTPVNDAPVATSLVVATAGSLAASFTLLGSDEEGSPLTFTITSMPSGGTLSGVAPNLTYTPAPCFWGMDSFTYKVNDGDLDSPPATVFITVTDFGVYYTITGRVSIGGAILSYDNDYLGPGETTADADGNYTINVYSCWSGTVTPSKPGYIFTPAKRVYSAPVLGGVVNQDYTAEKVATYYSTGGEDGWVLESTETSNTGGGLNTAAQTFLLGDDNANRQYKALLSFKTDDIPANALIKSAVLKIRPSGAPVGTNPFDILGNLWADIRKGSFGAATLQASDFQVTTRTTKAGFFNKTTAGNWYSATLNATGRANINRTGLTQFRLYFAKDDNNNTAADYLGFFSGNNLSAKPTLIITYALPLTP